MAWAGIEQRRGRNVLPTDIFVIIFLALGIAGASSASTDNAIAVVVFTLVWMTAAITRLTEFRRGDRPALQLSALDLRTKAILVVGGGPWIVLGFLQSAYASSVVLKPIDVPPPLQAVGIALAVAVIAEPFLDPSRRSALDAQGRRAAGSTVHAYRFSSSVMIRSGAILLLSGSPVFALLCALWLGATLWPATSASGGGRMRAVRWTPIPSASRFSESAGYPDRVDNAIPAPLT